MPSYLGNSYFLSKSPWKHLYNKALRPYLYICMYSRNLTKDLSTYSMKHSVWGCQSLFWLNNKLTIFVCMYVCIFVLAKAGQTAGPNWLTLFEGTHGYWVFFLYKTRFFSKFKNTLLHRKRRALFMQTW